MCLTTDETQHPLLPVNNSQQEYCITNDGDVLQAGESWKANACTSCTCNNGTIQCFSQRCPAANCRVPVLRKGQCCPHCLGEYEGASQRLVCACRQGIEYFNAPKSQLQSTLSSGLLNAACIATRNVVYVTLPQSESRSRQSCVTVLLLLGVLLQGQAPACCWGKF